MIMFVKDRSIDWNKLIYIYKQMGETYEGGD